MLFGVVLIKIDNSAGNYNRTFIEVRLLLHELTITQNEHPNHIPEKNNLTSSNFGSNPVDGRIEFALPGKSSYLASRKKSSPHKKKLEDIP